MPPCDYLLFMQFLSINFTRKGPITCPGNHIIHWVFQCLQRVSHQWIIWKNDSFSGACVILRSLAVCFFVFLFSENEYTLDWWLIKEGFGIISSVGSRVCSVATAIFTLSGAASLASEQRVIMEIVFATFQLWKQNCELGGTKSFLSSTHFFWWLTINVLCRWARLAPLFF